MKYCLLRFPLPSPPPQSGDKTLNCCRVQSSSTFPVHFGHYPMVAGGKQPHGLEWILAWGIYLYLEEKKQEGPMETVGVVCSEQ